MQYYYLDHNNQQKGPLNKDQLKTVGIKPDTKVWAEGMSHWTPAKIVEDLENIIVFQADYYVADRNNQQTGPFNIDQLKSLGITPTTLVWTKGLDSWKPAKEVEQLKSLVSQVPPVQQPVLTVKPPENTAEVEEEVDDKTPVDRVKKLAKDRNKNAYYEMAWRLELLPAKDRNDPVESCAWQDYWFEKAADAGHVDARSRYARSLLDRIMNEEDRKKAMRYFESLVADFDAGKLNKEQALDGKISKMWLGVMLCEGYHTMRDAKRGAELIQAAHSLTDGFKEFGFKSLSKIGEIYASGLAQEGEEPSIADLEKAVIYFELAVKRFKPENDPNNRGYLQLNKDLLATCKKRIESKKELKSSIGREDTVFVGAAERRRKMMEISEPARQRMNADKAALARLRERLKREGW